MKVTNSKKVTNSEPSTIKSNLQKLQAIKKVTKNNKKWKRSTKTACHYLKTTCHYGLFFVVKQPLACILTGIVVRSYV